MVRNYRRKRPIRYSKMDLMEAVHAVKKRKMKVSAAAARFGIPQSTLYDHAKGDIRIGAGSPTILSHAEEKEIVVTLQVLQEMGFGLTKELAGIVIRDYLHDQMFRPNPFKDGIPGRDWWQLFLRRWKKEISERKPQHLPTNRAISATPEVFDKWFEKVDKLFSDIGFKDMGEDELQHRVWNCDESGFCTAVASKKILAKRGEKEVHETMGGTGREYITILACGCADGTRLPPYVVYKGKNLWARWMKNGPAGCLYSVSDSGWMERSNFLQWFSKMYIPAVKHIAPVVLFFDGHHSHISLELLKVARSNNIHLVCLPPHVTHLIQPLDVSVFGPVKNEWRKILKMYQIQTRASIITKEDFPSLLAELCEKSFLPSHFKSGFRRSGIHPLNRDAIPSSKLSKSLPFTGKSSGQEDETGSQVDDNSSSCSESHDSNVVINLQGTVTTEEGSTPIHLQLRGYFARILASKKKSDGKSVDKRKVKPSFYGEALTTDEVFERLEKEENEKEEKKQALAAKQKKKENAKKEKKQALATKRKKGATKKKATISGGKRVTKDTQKTKEDAVEGGNESEDDTGVCEECGTIYADDSQEGKEKWIGCDNCPRWYHYDCVGLTSIPSGFWSCDLCENECN